VHPNEAEIDVFFWQDASSKTVVLPLPTLLDPMVVEVEANIRMIRYLASQATLTVIHLAYLSR
jgi:hypothetical protein